MRFQMYISGVALALCACEPKLASPPPESVSTQLADGQITLTVSPADGGRLSSMIYRDQERLSLKSERDPANWGSTLWISPQSSWGWPPPDALDNLPYALQGTDKQRTLKGPVDQQKTGLRIDKTIQLLGGDRIALRYQMTRPAGEAAPAAAWEVTRVPIRGLVLFAHEPEPLWFSFGSFPYTTFGDVTWIDLRQSELSEGKLNANGRGWIAWVDGRDLFIKRYADLRKEQQAPTEAETQLYISPRGYMELEAQGAYQDIAVGESISFETEWQWLRLPQDVVVDVDSPSLMTYLQSVGLPL